MTSTRDDTPTASTPAPIKQPKTGTQLLEEMRRAHLMESYAGKRLVTLVVSKRVAVETKQEKAPEKNGDAVTAQSQHKDIKTVFPPPATPARQWNYPSPQNILSPTSEATTVVQAPAVKLKLSAIVEAGAEIMQVRLDRLISKERSREVSHPRRAIIYFMLRYTGCSSPQAAKAMNFKDHTSCLYANRKMVEILEGGPVTHGDEQLVEGLKKLCEHFGKEFPTRPY